MWAEASTPQTTSFPGRLTEVRSTGGRHRLQVRLRIGRLTLGLTVADRWECSQATGLPAWRHQDLHITPNRATRYHRHSNRRICHAVLVQAGPCV